MMPRIAAPLSPKLNLPQDLGAWFRISADGVEIGSVSKRQSQSTRPAPIGTWGVDVMPLMDHGGRPPDGEAETFEAALVAVKTAFTAWQAAVPADVWMHNVEHIEHCAARRRR